MDCYSDESPIILTSGIEFSIRELVEIVVRKMKFKGKILFDSSKPDGQYRKPSDTSKLNNYLPEFKWTPLEEGIELTVEWFMKNYPNIRL